MINIRNIAIIAHVDHGKTTLVDALLRQSKTKLKKEISEKTCIMDSNELERERGITIFSKNASIHYNNTKINIIDTPGHADFGGEVERVLKMADGCLLLVDAQEGPMPQTRFVLKKALEMKHKMIVVINKIDKPFARPAYALDKTFELFLELGADDEVANFPVVYASAKQGKAGLTPEIEKMKDITPLFDAILKNIKEPSGDENAPLQMLITSVREDNFKGRIAVGRIYNGSLKNKQEVTHIKRDGQQEKAWLNSLLTFDGLERIEVNEVSCGDIVAIAGIPNVKIGETIADPINPKALPVLNIEEPTIKMTFSINDSPFAGKEGKFTTSRQIAERLRKELKTDMALKVKDTSEGNWIVSGRGELHLAILIERMRREGFEFQVSRPQVIYKEINNQKMAPYERIFIEAPEKYQGIIIQKLGSRHAELIDMKIDNGLVYLEFVIPTKGLFGYRSQFKTDTRGLGIINACFYKYQPDNFNWKERDQGSLISNETGKTCHYGLTNVQDRGSMFLGPGISVYEGQVVGQNSRSNDLVVNACKEKKLSNMRSKGEGVAVHFNAPKIMDLEDALEYISDDELVEVTPQNIRIRKKFLNENDRRRNSRK